MAHANPPRIFRIVVYTLVIDPSFAMTGGASHDASFHLGFASAVEGTATAILIAFIGAGFSLLLVVFFTRCTHRRPADIEEPPVPSTSEDTGVLQPLPAALLAPAVEVSPGDTRVLQPLLLLLSLLSEDTVVLLPLPAVFPASQGPADGVPFREHQGSPTRGGAFASFQEHLASLGPTNGVSGFPEHQGSTGGVSPFREHPGSPDPTGGVSGSSEHQGSSALSSFQEHCGSITPTSGVSGSLEHQGFTDGVSPGLPKP